MHNFLHFRCTKLCTRPRFAGESARLVRNAVNGGRSYHQEIRGGHAHAYMIRRYSVSPCMQSVGILRISNGRYLIPRPRFGSYSRLLCSESKTVERSESMLVPSPVRSVVLRKHKDSLGTLQSVALYRKELDKVFEQMKISEATVLRAINNCRSRLAQLPEDRLKELENFAARLHKRGYIMSEEIYYHLIDVSFSLDETGAAGFRYIDEMKLNGFNVNSGIYNLVLQYYCSTKNMIAANEVLSEMEELGIATEDMYISLIQTYGSNPLNDSKVIDMIERAESASNLTLGAKAYTQYMATIANRADNNRFRSIMTVWNMMLNKGIEPNAHSARTAILACKSEANLWAVMTKLEATDLLSDPFVMRALTVAYAKFNKFSEVKDILLTTYDGNTKVMGEFDGTLAGVLSQFGKSKLYNRIHELYDFVTEQNFPIDQRFCTMLMVQFSKGGYPEKAKEVFSILRNYEGGYDTQAANAIIFVLAKEGDIDGAVKIMSEISHMDGQAIDSYTVTPILSAAARANDYNVISMLRNLMRQLNIVPLQAGLKAVFDMYRRQGDLDNLMPLYNEMTENATIVDPALIGPVIELNVACGYIDNAFAWFRKAHSYPDFTKASLIPVPVCNDIHRSLALQLENAGIPESYQSVLTPLSKTAHSVTTRKCASSIVPWIRLVNRCSLGDMVLHWPTTFRPNSKTPRNQNYNKVESPLSIQLIDEANDPLAAFRETPRAGKDFYHPLPYEDGMLEEAQREIGVEDKELFEIYKRKMTVNQNNLVAMGQQVDKKQLINEYMEYGEVRLGKEKQVLDKNDVRWLADLEEIEKMRIYDRRHTARKQSAYAKENVEKKPSAQAQWNKEIYSVDKKPHASDKDRDRSISCAGKKANRHKIAPPDIERSESLHSTEMETSVDVKHKLTPVYEEHDGLHDSENKGKHMKTESATIIEGEKGTCLTPTIYSHTWLEEDKKYVSVEELEQSWFGGPTFKRQATNTPLSPTSSTQGLHTDERDASMTIDDTQSKPVFSSAAAAFASLSGSLDLKSVLHSAHQASLSATEGVHPISAESMRVSSDMKGSPDRAENNSRLSVLDKDQLRNSSSSSCSDGVLRESVKCTVLDRVRMRLASSDSICTLSKLKPMMTSSLPENSNLNNQVAAFMHLLHKTRSNRSVPVHMPSPTNTRGSSETNSLTHPTYPDIPIAVPEELLRRFT